MVSATTTIKARAFATGMTDSETATETYTISAGGKVATPTFSSAGGAYSSLHLQLTLSCSTIGAILHFTIDGSEPSSLSPIFFTSILVRDNTTIKAKAFKDGLADSDTASATYTTNTPTISAVPLLDNRLRYVAFGVSVIATVVGGLLLLWKGRKSARTFRGKSTLAS